MKLLPIVVVTKSIHREVQGPVLCRRRRLASVPGSVQLTPAERSLGPLGSTHTGIVSTITRAVADPGLGVRGCRGRPRAVPFHSGKSIICGFWYLGAGRGCSGTNPPQAPRDNRVSGSQKLYVDFHWAEGSVSLSLALFTGRLRFQGLNSSQPTAEGTDTQRGPGASPRSPGQTSLRCRPL